jgi:hypothetical protein
MLARQLSDLAAGGSRLRHVNINYLVSPITNPRSAHAKLILLTDVTVECSRFYGRRIRLPID